MPSALVVAVCVTLVPRVVAVILTLCITAWDWSNTVPVIVPVLDWANTDGENARTQAISLRLEFLHFHPDLF